MKSSFSWKRVAGLIIICLLVGTLSFGQFNVSNAQTKTFLAPSTPIEHIVILIQENNAFDHFFGTFPGINSTFSLNPNICYPYVLGESTPCVYPWNADGNYSAVMRNGLNHNWQESHTGYDRGLMNGFVAAAVKDKKPSPQDAVSYFTGKTLPNYWDYASYYGLDVNFFSSTLSYSYPNHLYIMAGQDGGLHNQKPSFNLHYPTLAGALTNNSVDWKSYNGNWNDSNDCKPVDSASFGDGNAGNQQAESDWNVLPDFPAIQLNSETCHNILNSNDFFKNITSGYLPQVAWITPNQSVSDHPGSSAKLPQGQEWVAKVANSIATSPFYNSTMLLVTWDDFGGYFDTVAPDQVDTYGYGFRVPLLIISPFTKSGSIFYGTRQEDFGAFLSTIEANYGLSPLTNRDAIAPPLFYTQNFSQPLLPPLVLPSNSLATYPFSACVSNGLCQIGFNLQPRVLSDPPIYPQFGPPCVGPADPSDPGDPCSD